MHALSSKFPNQSNTLDPGVINKSTLAMLNNILININYIPWCLK